MTDNELIDRIAYEIWIDNILPKPLFNDWKNSTWQGDEEKVILRKLAKRLISIVRRNTKTLSIPDKRLTLAIGKNLDGTPVNPIVQNRGINDDD